jgi:hypothetical protein
MIDIQMHNLFSQALTKIKNGNKNYFRKPINLAKSWFRLSLNDELHAFVWA